MDTASGLAAAAGAPLLDALDWVVIGAAAVALYVMADMWLASRGAAPAEAEE